MCKLEKIIDSVKLFFAVFFFSFNMYLELLKNTKKGKVGWEYNGESYSYIWNCAMGKLTTLSKNRLKTPEEKDAIDLANFAMMLLRRIKYGTYE